MNISSYIDHTLLHPASTEAEVIQRCTEARKEGFAAVCIPPYFVKTAAEALKGTDCRVATVIGFPLGYSFTDAKLQEIRQAIEDGADELDMVHNITALKNGDRAYLLRETETLIGPVKASGKVIKIIVESGMLTDEELVQCCRLYANTGIDFLKTSTGYADTGASVRAVHIMKAYLPSSVRIKASGGIRTFAFAKELIEAGASRIGCSAGMKILEECRNHNKQLK